MKVFTMFTIRYFIHMKDVLVFQTRAGSVWNENGYNSPRQCTYFDLKGLPLKIVSNFILNPIFFLIKIDSHYEMPAQHNETSMAIMVDFNNREIIEAITSRTQRLVNFLNKFGSSLQTFSKPSLKAKWSTKNYKDDTWLRNWTKNWRPWSGKCRTLKRGRWRWRRRKPTLTDERQDPLRIAGFLQWRLPLNGPPWFRRRLVCQQCLPFPKSRNDFDGVEGTRERGFVHA